VTKKVVGVFVRFRAPPQRTTWTHIVTCQSPILNHPQQTFDSFDSKGNDIFNDLGADADAAMCGKVSSVKLFFIHVKAKDASESSVRSWALKMILKNRSYKNHTAFENICQER
jgi:hypothetical protein